MKQLVTDFKKANQKVLFLDYDGTLTPLIKHHSLAKPTDEIVILLKKISNLPNTDLVIISGRNKESLQEWLPISNITLIAEHGVWIKKPDNNWELSKNITNNWKLKVIQLLKKYTDKTNGTFVEEKDYSVAWHYINLNPNLIFEKTTLLLKELNELIKNTELEILQGKKIIEVRNSSINKGNTALEFINNKNYDFILAAGDDLTDEEMFKYLPEKTYTIKVGPGHSIAKYHLDNTIEITNLLNAIYSK